MSKLITLACALLAIGLGAWSLVAVRQADATLDEAQALNSGAARRLREPASADARAADLLAADVQADAAMRLRDQAASPSQGLPVPIYQRPYARVREEDRDEAGEQNLPLPTPGPILPSRARAAAIAPTSQNPMGYTLPQSTIPAPAGQPPQ